MQAKLVLAGVIIACATAGADAAWLSGTPDGPLSAGGGVAGTTNTILTLDISGRNTWDLLGDPSNEVIFIDLAAMLGLAPGSTVTMVSIGWDTNQTAHGSSWLSEMRMYFDDAIAPDNIGLFLRPGAGVNAPGTQSFSSGGQIDLSGAGIANIVLPNGILRLDFHETFDDLPDTIDGTFDAGSFLHIGVMEVPGPASIALLGVAALVGVRRRR